MVAPASRQQAQVFDSSDVVGEHDALCHLDREVIDESGELAVRECLAHRGVGQFRHGQVDCDPEPFRERGCRQEVLGQKIQHQAPELPDLAVGLRHGHEPGCRDHLAVPLPTQQCFGREVASVAEVRHRLVVELEGLLPHCPGEALACGGDAAGAGRHGFVEGDDSVATVVLGLVHRKVRQMHQLIGTFPVPRKVHDADGGRQQGCGILEANRLVHCSKCTLGDGVGIGMFAEVGHQDAELIAGQAGDCVRGPRRTAQARCHLPEGVVAARVAELVVDRLETVQIDPQHRTFRVRVPLLVRPRGRGAREAHRGWSGR